MHLIGDITEEDFKEMGLGGFEVSTADGGMADLPTPGGASRKVTLENRLEFADMAEAFKMREFWEPVRQRTVETIGTTYNALGAIYLAGTGYLHVLKPIGSDCTIPTLHMLQRALGEA